MNQSKLTTTCIVIAAFAIIFLMYSSIHDSKPKETHSEVPLIAKPQPVLMERRTGEDFIRVIHPSVILHSTMKPIVCRLRGAWVITFKEVK